MEKPSRENPNTSDMAQKTVKSKEEQEEWNQTMKQEWEKIYPLYEKVKEKAENVFGKRWSVWWNENDMADFKERLIIKYGEKICKTNLYFRLISGCSLCVKLEDGTEAFEESITSIEDFEEEYSVATFLHNLLKKFEELEEQKQEL